MNVAHWWYIVYVLTHHYSQSSSVVALPKSRQRTDKQTEKGGHQHTTSAAKLNERQANEPTNLGDKMRWHVLFPPPSCLMCSSSLVLRIGMLAPGGLFAFPNRPPCPPPRFWHKICSIQEKPKSCLAQAGMPAITSHQGHCV